MSDWPLTEELIQIRETTRRFMVNDVKPAEEKVEHDAVSLPDDLLKPLQKKAKDLGIWCIRSPEKYGGAGLSLLGQAIVAEETARCKMGAYIPGCGSIGFDPPNAIFAGGTPEQIEKYGVAAIRDGEKCFFAISEPSGGSDPARAIRTRAVKRGDKYILNGTKTWISGVKNANWGIVFARTGDQGDRGGISAFIVEKGMPGFSWSEIGVIRAWSPYELTFDNCEVPAENLLGVEGRGFDLLGMWTVEGRIPYAAGTIGIAQEALEMAVTWVRDREVFKSKLADKQAIQFMIADSETELQAARMMVYKAAMIHETGDGDLRHWSSMCKVYGTETAFRVVDRCVQMFGGLGVAKEMPLERWFRELRIKRIGEGPSEVQRMVVARKILNANGPVS